MKLFKKAKDGGPESRVYGFFVIEAKKLFTIAGLRFEDGSREAYHSHAFNAMSWLLTGTLIEHVLHEDGRVEVVQYWPSLRPIITRRDRCHKFVSYGVSLALSFRGPWSPTWFDVVDGKRITLTHGRQVVDDTLDDEPEVI
jgi:hypothetical protein